MMAIPAPGRESQYALPTGLHRKRARRPDRSPARRHCAHATLTLQVGPTVLPDLTPPPQCEREGDEESPTGALLDLSTHSAKGARRTRANALFDLQVGRRPRR